MSASMKQLQMQAAFLDERAKWLEDIGSGIGGLDFEIRAIRAGAEAIRQQIATYSASAVPALEAR